METASTISDTDVQIFMAAVNPDKIHMTASRSSPRIRELNNAGRSSSYAMPTEDEIASDDAGRGTEGDDEEDDEREEDQDAEGEDEDEDEDEGEDGTESAEDTCPRVPLFHPGMRELSGSSDTASVASTSSRQKHPAGTATSVNGAFTKFMNEGHARNPKAAPDTRHADEEEVLEKQTVLLDMERLKMQGVKLTKDWTIDDSLDDMQFELKRLMLHVDETNNISMMRNSLQLACTGIELLNTRMGVLDLRGWSEEVCRDMSKYDRSLGRMYRKYWRRSHSTNPEMDILLGLVGSAGSYHFRKSFTKQMMNPAASRGQSRSRRPRGRDGSDESDEEGLPP